MRTKNILIAIAVFTLCCFASSCVKESGFEERVKDIAKTDSLTSRIATVEEQTAQLTSSVTTLTEEHNKLQKFTGELSAKVAEMEKELATVDARIAAVKAELKDSLDKQKTALIGMLEDYKAEIKGQIDGINGQITTLKSADSTLQVRIDDLQKYVNDTLKGTQDWARATFATLAQKDSLAEVTAAIDVYAKAVNNKVDSLASVHSEDTAMIFAAIRALDSKSSKALETAVQELNGTIEKTAATIKTEYTAAIKPAVEKSEASIKGWVNDTLNAYYTAATVDAKVKVAMEEIDSLSKVTLAAEKRIDTLETTLTTAIKNIKDSLNTAYSNIQTARDSLRTLDDKIDAMRTEITAAYRSAIKDSLDTLRLVMNDSLKKVNERVSALADGMTTVEGRVSTLEGQMNTVRDSVQKLQAEIAGLRTDVDRLIARIQSIRVVPEYRNGSVAIKNSGTVDISFEVRPASLAKAIVDAKGATAFHLQAVETKAVTKAVTYIDLTVTNPTVGSDSVLTLAVAKGDLPEEFFAGTKCYNARLRISDGNTDRASAYFPLVNVYSFDSDTVSVEKDKSATVTLLLGTAAVTDAQTTDFSLSGTSTGISVTSVTAGVVTITATASATAESDVRLQYKKNGTGAVLAETVVELVTGPPVYPGAPAGAVAVKMKGAGTDSIWYAPVNCGYDESHKYGLLYQFGRKVGSTYGPEKTAKKQFEESNYQTGVAASYPDGCNKNPEDTTFYLIGNVTTTADWYADNEDGQLSEWPMTDPSGTTGIGNPCPTGWRVPTWTELDTLILAPRSKITHDGMVGNLYDDKLFLPAAGTRSYDLDEPYVEERGTKGYYWSSAVSTGETKVQATYMGFLPDKMTVLGPGSRAYGCSVRCVHD